LALETSPFITAARTCSKRCAPCGDPLICWRLFILRFTRRLTADSTRAVDIGCPLHCLPLRPRQGSFDLRPRGKIERRQYRGRVPALGSGGEATQKQLASARSGAPRGRCGRAPSPVPSRSRPAGSGAEVRELFSTKGQPRVSRAGRQTRRSIGRSEALDPRSCGCSVRSSELFGARHGRIQYRSVAFDS
jgi:hypothetical protein